ncbi:MAG: trimeric intracellular cation channel family protein [Saprospiraceae bacterium]|mgnify:CR=1 FL=1|nr:trimeric intracellular cation channel family protein [Saprospiraceae bacterium]MDZ4706357.1 trimeric intracellular cation channel family protein [Saprospiraceae bacterium]
MNLIDFFSFAGTFLFAVSGALAAMEKKLDVFGAFVIALATAVGGGTFRDLLIGKQPVVWLTNTWYLVLVVAAVPVSHIFKGSFQKMRKSMFLFDSMGIGLFTILGLERTLDAGLSPMAAVLMGAVSAVFGGVLRDILCNEIPIIFRKEIYATACIAGGILYLLLESCLEQRSFNMVITVCFITVIRILAVKRRWRLEFR